MIKYFKCALSSGGAGFIEGLFHVMVAAFGLRYVIPETKFIFWWLRRRIKPFGRWPCGAWYIPLFVYHPVDQEINPQIREHYIMVNNDILRRVRYLFDFSDFKMAEICGLADYAVTREQVSEWLKKEDDPAYKKCTDMQLAIFLNGLIVDKRGKKEGAKTEPEKRLTNNMIFTKLKIALNLKAEDIIEIMALANFRISKSELSAFFRKPDHKHYRDCQDQILRNFLQGLQLKYRPE